MESDVQKAFDELRNAIWMLAIPLIMGIISLIGAVQWGIQDREWEERLDSHVEMIQEVDASKCLQPRPAGEGHICAESTDWWSVIASTDCAGGECYALSYLVEYEESYYPLFVSGLLPLIFLFVVMRKIIKARSALKAVLNSYTASNSV